MTRAPQTRQSLLLELGKRSDEAWTEFLEVYENAIFRYCRSMGLQEADALDATQEVLTAVHLRLPSWEAKGSNGSFRAWLFRVARNISVDAISERGRGLTAKGGTQMELALADLADPAQGRSEVFDVELRRSLFEWAADQTRSEVQSLTWKAFHQTAVLGRKAEEVAAELGVSVGSVYTAKCRVVARLRERVERLSGEFPIVDPSSKQ